MKFTKTKAFSAVKFLLPLAILIIVGYEGGRFIAGIDAGLLKKHASDVGYHKALLILSFGLIAVLPMSFFDVILMKLLGRRLAVKRLLQYSFIANAYSNFLGFGGLTGAAIRTYFYKTRDQSRMEIIKAIAKISVFYLSGLSLLSWLIILGILDSPVFKTYKWLYAGILAIAVYLPVLLITLHIKGNRGKNRMLQAKYEIGLILVSFAEWFCALLTMWGAARVMGLDINLLALAPVYLTAACAGVLSMIPSGLGSFDLIFMLGIESYGLPKEKVVLLLLIYRITYNFFPWLVSSFLLGSHFWSVLNKKWRNLPSYTAANISHGLLTFLVFLTGIILLLSAAFPSALGGIKALSEVFPSGFVGISHQLSVASGFTLLALARGIELRVRWVYYLTLGILILGSLFTFVKGLDVKEALFCLIVALLLYAARNRFYRVQFSFSWGRGIFDGVMFLLFIALYFTAGYLNLPQSEGRIPARFEEYIIKDSTELFLSGLAGLLICGVVMGAGWALSRSSKFPFLAASTNLGRIKNILTVHGGNGFSNLLYMPDTYVYFSSSGTVLFAYRRFVDKLVILGGPSGKRDDFIDAMEEFQDEADRFGLSLVYYQVRSSMLPFLNAHGYDFYKLGEETLVKLKELDRGQKRKLDIINSKFSRQNYKFEVVQPPYSDSLLTEAEKVSEEWLDGRKEKGFSHASFQKKYLNQFPLAILKDPGGRIIAFAVVIPGYDSSSTVRADLLRHTLQAPGGSMNYLLSCLLKWAADKGYDSFNLGITPLAGGSTEKYMTSSEKAASLIYMSGYYLYPFHGISRFNLKYGDEREPNYLGYRKKSSLPILMLQLSFLMARTRRNKPGRAVKLSREERNSDQ
ncbi:bifunctional lysylphosphatidylglycerol flippase/synthetase MprF [Peribacillus sp. SCS-26]|uniref:bifunctional lysylphosphatidylglycerol flippase/synthetase MprF n=1 Tax=Paraperibacillus marinus TaxID=3115295 RepID=UPI0039067B25